MSDDTAEWRVFTGDQLHLQPPEVQRQVEERLRRVPLLDLRVRVFDLAPGQSEIQLWVEPDGALGAAHPDDPDREAAADLLLAVVAREVREAVAILCRGR